MTNELAATVMASMLPVPGAELYFERRGGGPLLILHAAPMDADSFALGRRAARSRPHGRHQ